ncbi:MAG: hypothetical protein ACE5H4_11655 [Candidatus Thorarchaeota archaeon]
MTRTTLATLSENQVHDWVRVYNEGRRNLPGFVPLTAQDLELLIKAGLCRRESMYIAFEGKRPTAVARFLESDTEGASFVTDLSSLSRRTSGAPALIENFMDKARVTAATSLISWSFMAQVRIGDILSKFTFEPKRVRQAMELQLDSKKEQVHSDDARVKTWENKDGHRGLPDWSRRLHGRPMDLFELRDHRSLDWRPRFVGLSQDLSTPFLIASRSRHNRKRGRIDLVSFFGASSVKEGELSGVIHELIKGLSDEGVTSVNTEIDAEIGLRRAFTECGFEVKRTLFQMELDILQD